MLSFDEQLFQQTNGQTGEKLERILQQDAAQPQADAIWGTPLPSEAFLLKREQAEKFCFHLLKNYWGKVNLFFYDWAELHIEQVNEKIQQFFDEPQNKSQLFTFIQMNGEIHFQQFIEFLFAKSIDVPKNATGLQRLIVYKVKNRYFVQPLYCEQLEYWEQICAKKIYSLFLQQPLLHLERSTQLMRTFQLLLQHHLSVNRIATIIHKLTQHIDYENPKSYDLKQLHLFNICLHYTSGRRHFKKLRKCVLQVQRDWSQGVFALNNQEQTLLAYMLFQEALFRKDHAAILENGSYLIEEDRLSNHAIGLVVDYAAIFNSLNPQPHALVKDYKANYLEQVFFELVNAFVEQNQLANAWKLIQHYELATCTVIFELLHEENPQPMLHKIEAEVQQDIAVLVDGTTHIIRDSLATWQEHYLMKKGPYYEVANRTSKHVCNLLKILFYAEQDALVEKLLAVYKKYLIVPAHFANLRQFIEQRTAIML